MKLAKSLLIDSRHNDLYASFAVAVSIVVFAYSGLLGPIAILLYYAVWFPLIVISPKLVTRKPADFILPMLFTLFAILSTFWSPVPSITLRGSLQILTHVICALTAARVTSTRGLLLGLLSGSFIAILYSLYVGNYGYDRMDGTYTFVGAFGSKNQLALYCSMGLYSCLAVFLLVKQSFLHKLYTLFAATILLYAISLSRSATAIGSLVAVLALLPFLIVTQRLRPSVRGALILLGVPFFIVGLVVALNYGAMELVLGAFGKDTTLTGRTYLWATGLAAAKLHPILGTGLQAYWVQGFPEAERLWVEFYIDSRVGFHFHNTYIELMVETGYVGLVLYVSMILVTLLRLSVRLAFFDDKQSVVLFGLLAMFPVRSLTEVEAPYPYAAGSFMFVFIYAVSKQHSIMRSFRRGAKLPTNRSERLTLRTPGLNGQTL